MVSTGIQYLAMDCASICRCARYLLILLIVITGVIILSVGASVKAYYHEYDAFLDDKYIYASDLLIIIGVIICIIAFFGWCAALEENVCMTVTFSTLLIIILILEIIVGIVGFILKHKTTESIEDALTKTMQEYGGNNTEVTEIWDQVQINFHCCGVYNYTDWINSTNSTNHFIPISCCSPFPAGSTAPVSCDQHNTTLIHPDGCVEEFGKYIEGLAISIESTGLTLAIIQLFGIILSCYLWKQIKSDYETV